jgi:hypothetical protein
MPERRYTDEEVASIFREAAEGQRSATLQRTDSDGLTLAELQSIGRDVGLAPDIVTRAALAIELRPQAASQSFLALPVGVERTITLGRTLTDTEWEHLVGELRTTFRAKGRMQASGPFREWTNGNLQVLLEPTSSGQRLRLSTEKGSARAGIFAGLALLGCAAVVWSSAILAGELVRVLPAVAMLTLTGVGLVAGTALQVRGWARLRGRQMDAIATRVAQSVRMLDTGTASGH